MNWPDLQIEHLGVAAALNWLAFAWFCWSYGQKLTARGSRVDATWNWLAGAALLAALQFLVWLGLMQLRLGGWPEWARAAVGAFTAAHGITAALCAWAWSGRSLSKAGGWCVLLGSALLTSGFISIAPYLSGAGWAILAAVLFRTEIVGLSRGGRLAMAGTLAVLALVQVFVPDLTQVMLRLPSELPPQWGSREFVTIGCTAVFALIAALILWLAERPQRWRIMLPGVLLAGLLFLLSWRSTAAHAAVRTRVWAELEQAAASFGPNFSKLKREADDFRRPEYTNLVAQMAAVEKPFGPHARLWLWSVRDGMVVHVADSASLGNQTAALKIPPGYSYPQLQNFVLRSARGERFESGPYFQSGERRLGMHVPLREAPSAAPLAWVQMSVPYAVWNGNFSDPRPAAVISILWLGGILALILSGQTWLEGARVLHSQVVIADASARAKNEMAGLVSHELRTPLQVVLGHLELLSATPQPPATERTLKIIEGQCRQLLGLVNDTLDLCALEAGQLPLRPVRFSPAVLAEVTIRDLRPLATERGLALDLVLQPGLPALVETDAARIRQILTNLLANGLKYTPKGGVQLRVELEDSPAGRLVFTVTDTGPGLPAAILAHLGEPFQTGPSHQGTGLGLAIVRRLSTHLGGEFTATNAPSGGCVATARLPAPAAVPDAPMFGSQSPVSAEPPALDGLRIVLAEDNTLVREMIATHLRGLGAQVEAVADGAAALFACRGQLPDAVILDLAMPGVDGRTAARALRNAAAGAATPKLIVGLSAEAISDEEARAAGFDRFFVKPIALADLAAVFAPSASGMKPSTSSLTRLHQLFQHEVPGQLSALHSAVALNNRPEIARLAHYLQGSAYALGDEPLLAACRDLRQWAEAPPDSATADRFVQRVEQEAARILDAL